MKKIASILLLSILAFNWLGYSLLSDLIERRSDSAFEARIDQGDYTESNLIELRVPLNTPYFTGNSAEFERYDGELEIGGVNYRYVKRKVADGELVLLCLPNDGKNRIRSSKTAFFKLVNDLDNSSKGKDKNPSGSFKSFVAEYTRENNSWSIAAPPAFSKQYAIAERSFQIPAYYSVLKQPPRI